MCGPSGVRETLVDGEARILTEIGISRLKTRYECRYTRQAAEAPTV
jgi:hypothetical protein